MNRRDLLEKLVGAYCRPQPWNLPKLGEPLRIFILRNNDIGDLIITTPLFSAIKQRFPNCRLLVGIGDWNRPILDGNPDVDETIQCNAPWHNKVSCHHSPNSPYGFLRSLRYIFFSNEARQIRQLRCHLAIDVLGSLEGTILHKHAGIPNRMGAKGYGGGYSGCQKWRQFKIDENASLSTLRYAEMLGVQQGDLPKLTPRLYLSSVEMCEGKGYWPVSNQDRKKVVISTGAGFKEKCWPAKNFKELAARLSNKDNLDLIFVGTQKEKNDGAEISRVVPGLRNLAGVTTLRETLAIVASSDFVICNSTMLMHAAAAFEIPSIVLLGQWYESGQLHHQQWGHKKCVVLGPEIKANKHNLTTVEEAFGHCLKVLN